MSYLAAVLLLNMDVYPGKNIYDSGVVLAVVVLGLLLLWLWWL